METFLTNENTFYIIPKEIENVTTMRLIDAFEDSLQFSYPQSVTNFEKDEAVEVFSNGVNGILYFKSKIIDSNNDTLLIKRPAEYDVLQRRENDRIVITESIKLSKNNNGESIDATIINLSVGGMKISIDEKVEINEVYSTKFDFDNLDMNFQFIPSRIEFIDNKYVVSGCLKSENVGNKIELIQYCYKKQFEIENRK